MKTESDISNQNFFYSDILQEDELGATIRARTYIESALEQLIKMLVADFGDAKKCSSISPKK